MTSRHPKAQDIAGRSRMPPCPRERHDLTCQYDPYSNRSSMQRLLAARRRLFFPGGPVRRVPFPLPSSELADFSADAARRT